MRKPLAALLLVPAAVAALAVPAGASTRTTWTHQTLRCQGGRHATWVQKIQGGVAVEGWYNNTCGHQWLTISACSGSGDTETCGAKDFPPRTKGTFTFGTPATAQLATAPSCPDSDICAF